MDKIPKITKINERLIKLRNEWISNKTKIRGLKEEVAKLKWQFVRQKHE